MWTHKYNNSKTRQRIAGTIVFENNRARVITSIRSPRLALQSADKAPNEYGDRRCSSRSLEQKAREHSRFSLTELSLTLEHFIPEKAEYADGTVLRKNKLTS